VKTGDIRDELLGVLDEEKADLVVMGTHGRRNIERFVLGSTTEALLRKVSVPLLTVSRVGETEDAKPGPAAIHHIVYATDFSAGAKVGIHYAAGLARTFQAGLTVIHVMDRLELRGSGLIAPLPDEVARMHQDLTVRMGQLSDPVRTEGLQLQTAILDGSPHQEIVRFAEGAKADLLVLNVQSKTFLERAMIGATAERVIRSARVPVLSIPVTTAARFITIT
jgi:nucleotide-binding universal stress UspA family protein